jgi:glyoxylase-like metal-dependent hydrolase (beta-lactamase superfamily II)
VPVVGVVVTHWHHDHAFGLAAFAGLDTLGHESVPERLGSAEAVAAAERLGLGPTELATPGRTVAVATALDLGDRRVEVVHLGRGHTDGDLVVVVPDADVLFAGDLIESAGPPQTGPDSSLDEWPNALDSLIGLMTDTTRAVPGHGDPVDRQFVFEARGHAAMAAAEARQPAARPQLPLL